MEEQADTGWEQAGAIETALQAVGATTGGPLHTLVLHMIVKTTSLSYLTCLVAHLKYEI